MQQPNLLRSWKADALDVFMEGIEAKAAEPAEEASTKAGQRGEDVVQ